MVCDLWMSDMDISATCFVENGSDILRHEIHPENSNVLASSLSHFDSAVCHQQGIGDMDMWPIL